MAINIYEPQFMIRMIEQIPQLRTFLKDTFFKRIRTFPTRSIQFDVKKGGISMAPFVSSRIGSTVMERQGYKTLTYIPPLVAPKRVLTVDDIDIRLPGEAVYNGYNPNERATQLLASDLVYLDNAITLREEWMIAMLLFTGRIPVQGEGVNDVITFDFENIIVVDSDKVWSNHETSDPMDDLFNAAELVSETGITADIAIADNSTMRNLIRNKKIMEMLDNKNYKMGNIAPEVVKNGVMYYGYLSEPGLHLYGYNAKYADNENPNPEYPDVDPGDRKFKPAVYQMIPKGKVFVGSTNMQAEMLYGVVIDHDIGSYMKPRVPKQWINQEPSERYVKISSRPLPCPADLESWAIIDAE